MSCQAWKHYNTLTVAPHRTFLHTALPVSVENSKNFSGHFPEFSLGNPPTRAPAHICTGRENKGKYGFTYECVSTARRLSVSASSFKAFFMSLEAAEAALQFPKLAGPPEKVCF